LKNFSPHKGIISLLLNRCRYFGKYWLQRRFYRNFISKSRISSTHFSYFSRPQLK